MNGRAHMARVRELPCVLCEKLGTAQETPTNAHHAFDTAARSDFLTVAICHYHHQGAGGFHHLGEREFNRRYKTSEAELLALTIARLQ
jgi:hypothetical protein